MPSLLEYSFKTRYFENFNRTKCRANGRHRLFTINLFLVATIMNGEKRIQRKMHAVEPIVNAAPHPKRNTLLILVNNENKIMVNAQIVNLAELHFKIKTFVRNNGDGSCDYCFESFRNINASDNPKEALVALDVQMETSFDTYVAVQNEVSSVFNILRNALSIRKYGLGFEDLNRAQMRDIKAKFPLLLSENVLRLN